MKTTIGSETMISNCLTNVGNYSKALRANNVKEILAVQRDYDNLKLEGSILRINISLGLEAEPKIHTALEQIINGHETTLQVERSTKIMFVDLLKPR